MMKEEIPIRDWLKMTGVVLLTIMLTRFVPFSEFFRNVNTLIHELAHALATLLLSGKVMYIHLFADQSGVTYSAFSEGWMLIPISAAGYPLAALFALLLFKLHASGKETAGLVIVAVLAVVGLALFVRNGYGMLWSAGFAALTIVVAIFAPAWLRKGYYLLIAFICLVESVVSSGVIVALALIDPANAGDAANLTKATFVPAPVWGILFVLFSLWCAKRSTALLFRRGFIRGGGASLSE